VAVAADLYQTLSNFSFFSELVLHHHDFAITLSFAGQSFRSAKEK